MAGDEETQGWIGATALDRDGEGLGLVDDVLYDLETERAEWATVRPAQGEPGIWLVPLVDVEVGEGELRLSFPRALIASAPHPADAEEIDTEQEAALYAHYGIAYDQDRSGSGLPERGSGPEADRLAEPSEPEAGAGAPEVTRREEELEVGTVPRQRRVRLKKRIVTERVTERVAVRTEQARVQREPLAPGDLAEAPPIAEEEHELTLRSEDAVASKRVVAKERVALEPETVVEEREVAAEVSREQVDVAPGEGPPR